MQEKVLVIDDDDSSRKALKWAMEAMGHEVKVAKDGENALQEIQSFIPDIVLCDITMPGIQGYELCEKMRADSRLRDTLFLAQTGHSSRQSKQLSSKAGFHYHLVKPIDINKLFEIVYLDRARNSSNTKKDQVAYS